MEVTGFSIQVLYASRIGKAGPIPEWRPFSPIYSFYTTAVYNLYTEGRLGSIMEASPFSIQLLYARHIGKAGSIPEWSSPSRLHIASIYKSYREGRRDSRMEASLCSIQLLYTSHMRKAGSTQRWQPLPFQYSSAYKSYREGRLDSRMGAAPHSTGKADSMLARRPPLFFPTLDATHIRKEDSIPEWRPHFYLHTASIQL